MIGGLADADHRTGSVGARGVKARVVKTADDDRARTFVRGLGDKFQ
jgi:hypothetical protein